MLHKVIKSNFIFIGTVLLFNILFLATHSFLNFNPQNFQPLIAYTSMMLFPLSLLILVTSLFSLPGAGFLMSFGAYIYGLQFFWLGSLLLFISSLLSFPIMRFSITRSAFLQKITQSFTQGHQKTSLLILCLLRMSPAIPFFFFTSLYQEKINLKLFLGLLISCFLNTLLYTLVGWNFRAQTLNKESLLFIFIPVVIVTMLSTIILYIKKSKL